MLISHGRRFIYIKSHKTAGTSVELALQTFCVRPGYEITDKTEALESEYGVVGHRGKVPGGADRPKWYNHMPATEIRACVAPEIWAGYAKIVNIRNPYSRAVSMFRFVRDASQNPERENMPQERATFRAFMQSRYRSYDHLVFVDDIFVPTHVIRKEHLADDLMLLSKALDLPPDDIRLAHFKKYEGRHTDRSVAEYFDDDSRDALLRMDGWAFDRFGYSTDPRDA